MRLAIADLKKSVFRRDGEQFVTPYLLRPRERRAELDGLIALYEAWLGRERASFPDDRPAELIGDFRLARCLTLCLSEWYVWVSPVWPGPANTDEAAALAERGIANPGQLRLALYDEVNRDAGGYLGAAEREAWLDAFAAACVPGGLARATLDTLLTLDADARATLRRLPGVETAPTAVELAARYNQRAVETMLANASIVEWQIAPTMAAGSGGGLGAVVKRVCFLARQMGVQYDVAFESASTPTQPFSTSGRGMTQRSVAYGSRSASEAYIDGSANDNGDFDAARTDGSELPRVAERPALYMVDDADGDVATGERAPARAPNLPGAQPHEWPESQPQFAAPTTLEQAQAAVVVTLYGPQEVMGAPNQYGERLARLCRALLGYRRALAPQGAALGGDDGLRGVARVYLYGRPMTFPLDDRLLRLLRLGATRGEIDVTDATNPGAADGATVAFDSSLERRLYADFTALERAGETAGWRIEREPEPLLVGGAILVPDFALTRGLRRVYLEIAGYWRPGYRERKARKLAALRGAAALVVAAPVSSRAEFAGLDDAFPFLWYRDNGAINAAQLVTVIERAYDDFAARLAALDLPRIRAEVTMRGRIPPTESMALLHCYTRDELAATRKLLTGDASDHTSGDISWIDGVGLCSARWRAEVVSRLLATVRAAPGGQLALANLRDALNASETGDPGDFTDEATEALARMAGAAVNRESLFAVMVCLPETGRVTEETSGADADDAPSVADTTPSAPQPTVPANEAAQRSSRRSAQPRRGFRRKEHDVPSVKPAASAFTQQTFFPPAPADDANPERPNATT